MKKVIMILALTAALTGCQFREDITELHASLIEIQKKVESLDSSISSLQILAEAYDNMFSINSITPIMEGDAVTGHIVDFSNGTSITIIEGKDGIDASVPEISIGLSDDGRWYWKLNGEWVLDSNGKTIPVTGYDGEDGITPATKIEDGYWYVSFDEGKTWILAARADGEKGDPGRQGDAVIADIDYTSSLDYVIFTMLDGSVIKIYTSDAFETLQQIRRQLNSNILAISHIIQSDMSGGYVRYVSPCVENGENVGWIIEMDDKAKVTAYRKTAESSLWRPSISLRKDLEDKWKWEMEGEPLYDEAGNPAGLESTPKLMVENNQWHLSLDDGRNWKPIGKAEEAARQPEMITGLADGEDGIRITLSNGSEINVNKIPGLDIRFSIQQDIPICAGKSVSIDYEIFEGKGSPEISVITADYWEASIDRRTDRVGTITVTAPDPWRDEDVKVMVNCDGEVVMESLTFTEAEFAVTYVDIIKEEVWLYEGYSTILEVAMTPADAVAEDLEWTSSDTDVVVVSPQGRIVAINEGEATITASGQGVSDVCHITVKEYIIPVESIRIPTPQISIEQNTSSHIYVEIEPFNATEKTARWESSDESIVEVSQTGTIWGRNIGEAVITVHIGGLSAECTVTVIPETPDRSFTERVKGVTFRMIHVKAGTFLMGNPDIADASNIRDVTISKDYFIAETETTQELWDAFMDVNDSHFKGDGRRPVDFVLHNRVFEFLDKLYQATGRKYRLPTEAEWEYAARGGNKSKGYLYSGSDTPHEVAAFGETTRIYINPATGFLRNETMPVKSFKPNELGIYDMSGNVNEWCIDYYAPYPKEPETDPSGPSEEPPMDPWGGYDNSSYRIHRGGHYESSSDECRSTWRGYLEPGYPYFHYGFRLVLTAEDTE